MEFTDYLSILRRYAALVAGTTILFFSLGYLGTVRRPPSFEASTTLTVEKPQSIPQATSQFYQYDEYYSQLASTLFADTIANWLRSPGPVVEIYQKAGLTPPQGSAAVVGRTFRVSKGEDTTVITLTVQDRDSGDAAKIIETAKGVLNAKVDELKTRNNDPSYFTLAATPAEVFRLRQNPVMTALLGAVSGLFVSLVVAFVLASLKAPRRPT